VKRLTACLLAALAASVSVAAEGADQRLGRLFFTPQQRATLDAGRSIAPAKPRRAARPSGPSEIRLDGIVTRSDGERTVWVNGRAYHNAAPSGVSVAPTADPARARVQVRTDRRPVEMRVGQQLDRAAGRVSEVYVRPRSPERAPRSDQPEDGNKQ
jgi:hypothetical protein